MGSGLKTIILTLLRIKLEKGHYSNTAFIFEELENNLHPEIQRRLFNYLYDFALKNNCQLFITSHSHVAINCFYGKDETSIYHVRQKAGTASPLPSRRRPSARMPASRLRRRSLHRSAADARKGRKERKHRRPRSAKRRDAPRNAALSSVPARPYGSV